MIDKRQFGKKSKQRCLVYIYIYIGLYIYIYIYHVYCLSGRMFANELGDWGTIPGSVIPKTQKG